MCGMCLIPSYKLLSLSTLNAIYNLTWCSFLSVMLTMCQVILVADSDKTVSTLNVDVSLKPAFQIPGMKHFIQEQWRFLISNSIQRQRRLLKLFFLNECCVLLRHSVHKSLTFPRKYKGTLTV